MLNCIASETNYFPCLNISDKFPHMESGRTNECHLKKNFKFCLGNITTSNHFHPLQGENCDSNSRLVVDEDDNGKSKLERVNHLLE